MRSSETTSTSAGNWIAGAALVFELAWIVGLAFSSGGPEVNDSPSRIASYYVDHRRTAMFGTYLLDGIAVPRCSYSPRRSAPRCDGRGLG